VFVIRNGGFVAYGAEGRFKVLAVVDTLDLGDDCAFKEVGTHRILGWKKDVHSTVQTGPRAADQVKVTVATFFNVPANNVVILQRGNALILLPAGQHVITNPNTTFRGFFSLGERQIKFKTQPAYTVEGVPVILNVNLRYRVFDPLALTSHYDDPFQALANPCQVSVNAVVSRLSYQQFMRSQKLGGDIPDVQHTPWLEAFKTECLTELAEQAAAHGIKILSFDVLDRELEGALGKDLEKQSEQVLRNQVQATQIELQNHINTETQRGKLEIAKVEADQKKTKADADYYAANKNADAQFYQTMKAANAAAESSQLSTTQEARNIIQLAQARQAEIAIVTEQEAKNILALAQARRQEIELIGAANASVPAGHAQKMQLARFEVEKRQALPAKTIYFGGDRADTGAIEGGVQGAFAAATGWGLAGDKTK
ncbi:hypothetical protein BDK51DRAFT_35245, partial [Blyttiomyces helicus]